MYAATSPPCPTLPPCPADASNQMARVPPGGAWSNHDRRRHISLSDFLYLAMVCFVSPKEPEGRPRREDPGSVSGQRVYYGGRSACGGSRRMGQARTDVDHDGLDMPSPASLASGDRCCFRPSPESPRSGGESDPATTGTEQSTARGSVFSCGKKFTVGDNERCSDVAE